MSGRPTHDPQWIAADPAGSRFVTANAGSGKTKTLIDRVARLLLGQAPPEAILCVTYTKAAAAEMQRRLFDRLGDWAVMADAKLRGKLAELTGDQPDDFDERELSDARALFARALETPGGLKIQTIHAFCEKLLRRFPLEAGVSPGFQMLDDAGSAAVAATARRAVARYSLSGEGAVAEAYARFSVALDYGAFQSMFAAFEQKRGGLADYLDRCGGLDGAVADVWRVCGFPDGPTDLSAVIADAVDAIDPARWRATAEVLARGGKTDQKCAEALYAFAAAPGLAAALAALFTAGGEGTPAAWPGKTSGLASRPDLREALLDDQADLELARARVRGARVAADTADALVLASAYLVAHAAAKRTTAALDFTDLVERTRALLTERADAAWVLYKLDGGIDHILVDEAQDTAPDQWAIVRALTDDFFAGAGSPGFQRRTDRTLFVVGDNKQSIYSFQGADPDRLESETEFHLERIRAGSGDGRAVPLTDSWRSTEEVLSFVDTVFATAETRAAVPPPRGEQSIVHIGRRTGHRGCVDLWPLEVEIKEPEREAWDAPLDEKGPGGADRRLAERIAAEVAALVARGDQVFDKDRREWRAAGWGDVLVLVRRRKALFEEILRALKRRRIPVAGADRLSLSGHIVFDDLMALARFCLFSDDDLTLAAVLKSPFCGWDDDALYALAHGRPGRLWRALSAAGDSEALALLTRLRRESRGLRPFEFFARALGSAGPDGRTMKRRILQRLGAEAEEAIDEFLAQVLAAEDRGVRDLESLVAAFSSLDITVKREMDQPRGEVRVMTAHGSKGLEAPIVILPEIALRGGAGRGSPLLETKDGGFLWCSSGADDGDASGQARERRDRKAKEESLRLLYVALTRARDRLVLCGRIAAGAKEETLRDWYGVLKSAFAAEGLAPHVRQAAVGDFTFTRYGPDPEVGAPAVALATPEVAGPPDWTRRPPTDEPAGLRYVSPSLVGRDDEGHPAAAAPSPLSARGGLGRYRRGEIIHRLLQLLPDVAPAERAAAAGRLLDKEPDLSPEQRAEMAEAALGVLNDPRFAEVFAPGSRPEAGVAGTAPQLPPGLAVSGRIDRMTITPDRVLVVDFKTNRPAPDRIEAADPAYLTQMAVYWAVLSEIFPGRQVEAALVWTDGPRLMPVPQALIDERLARLRQAG